MTWLLALLLCLGGCTSKEAYSVAAPESQASFKVATMSIGGLKLGDSKKQIIEVLGAPESKIQTEGPAEVWDYPDFSVVIESDQATQLIGEKTLVFKGQDLPVGISLKEFLSKTKISEDLLPKNIPEKMTKSIRIFGQDGSLILDCSRERVKMYGLEIE